MFGIDRQKHGAGPAGGLTPQQMLKVEIDGRAIEVPNGATVMDAATKLGIFVPQAQAAVALDVLRAAPGGAHAAVIGKVGAGAGRVTLRSPYGTDRPLDLPAGELLPRIC